MRGLLPLAADLCGCEMFNRRVRGLVTIEPANRDKKDRYLFIHVHFFKALTT